MSNKEKKDEIIKAEKYRKISTFVLFIGIFLSGAGKTYKSVKLLIVAAILFIISLAIKFIYWRCPYCKKSLSMKVGLNDLNHCPKCGEKLV